MRKLKLFSIGCVLLSLVCVSSSILFGWPNLVKDKTLVEIFQGNSFEVRRIEEILNSFPYYRKKVRIQEHSIIAYESERDELQLLLASEGFPSQREPDSDPKYRLTMELRKLPEVTNVLVEVLQDTQSQIVSVNILVNPKSNKKLSKLTLDSVKDHTFKMFPYLRPDRLYISDATFSVFYDHT